MSTKPEIRVTIVVVPRESFDMFPEVVERIYRLTSPIFKMLVMEGAAPESIRRQLRELERTKPHCTIVWSDRWVYPHEAVNQAIPMIDTEYVVFIDNDVEVMEGWLEALVACADEERVNCVHPIYLTTRADAPVLKIHVAQGTFVRERRNGKQFIDTIATYSGAPLETYPDQQRKPSDFFEWHCVMFRRSILDKIGPMADMIIAEHVDYSLRFHERGERIWLEPKAVVAYDYERIFALRGTDRRYLLYRWDVKKSEESLRRLRERWNLSDDSTARRLYWVKEHTGRVRHTFLLPRVVNKVRRTVGLPNMPYCRDPRPKILMGK
jgi:glycosyltransferase involved in cell wall biosynthesis